MVDNGADWEIIPDRIDVVVMCSMGVAYGGKVVPIRGWAVRD